jgi:riboflavin synthase
MASNFFTSADRSDLFLLRPIQANKPRAAVDLTTYSTENAMWRFLFLLPGSVAYVLSTTGFDRLVQGKNGPAPRASPIFRCGTQNHGKPTAAVSSLSSSPSSRSLGTALTMFTGIVEEMGTVVALEEKDDMILWDGTKGSGTTLQVRANTVLDGAYIGCSICVSGVCLTATALSDQTFTVGLAPETIRRTYLGRLQTGDRVNLERASEIGGRNSGHFVQGHVDGTGQIVERWNEQDSVFFRIQLADPDLLPYIVPKGFIAIDGTSLTVVDVDHETTTFTFMLIEYTQKKIVVGQKMVGDLVNIEVDVLAKYAEATLAPVLPRLAAMEAKIIELEAKLAAMATNSD